MNSLEKKLKSMEKMGKTDNWLSIHMVNTQENGWIYQVCWNPRKSITQPRYQEEIKDNEILEAAVVAATRYFEEKGENK